MKNKIKRIIKMLLTQKSEFFFRHNKIKIRKGNVCQFNKKTMSRFLFFTRSDWTWKLLLSCFITACFYLSNNIFFDFLIKKFDFRGLIICTCINVIFEVLKSAYYVNADCYRLLSFRYIMVLAFGCYLAIGKKALNWKIYLTSFVIGTVYIIVTQYIGKTPVFTEYWTVTSFWACMYILPLVSWLFHRKKLRFKPIEIIGKASYNIFLVQMIYYLFLSDRVYRFFDNAYLELSLNILICVSVGLVFYYVETPITKWIIKKANGLFFKKTTK